MVYPDQEEPLKEPVTDNLSGFGENDSQDSRPPTMSSMPTGTLIRRQNPGPNTFWLRDFKNFLPMVLIALVMIYIWPTRWGFWEMIAFLSP